MRGGAESEGADMAEAENPYKGFMRDFVIADKFGESAIRNTYERAFNEWKNNVQFFASLVCTLNHQIWNHHEAGNEAIARVYDELWKKADAFAYDHFTGKDIKYYSDFLD